MKHKIIYTGSFNFPNLDAAAARVLSNAKVLRDLGYEVIFYGIEKKGREEDLNSDGKYYYQGFEYYSINNKQRENGFKNYINKGKNIFEELQSLRDDIYSIILYNSNTLFTKRAIKFSQKNKINLILDLTEWYNGNNLPFGKFGPINLDNQYRMRYLNFKVANLIVISDYLFKYYSKKGLNVIQIPPLVDLNEKKWIVEKQKHIGRKNLRFVYAGTPAKKGFFGKLKEKDFLQNFIDAIDFLKAEEDIVVYLDVYGIKKEDFSSFYNISKLKINKQITCYGRINQEQIPNQLNKSDYSVLLRPVKQYTKAGFSTKLVESMSSGIPVFTNKNHGDVNCIIGNNETGYLASGYSKEDIIENIKHLNEESKDVHINRGGKAKTYAITHFDYRTKTKDLESFFKSIKN